MNSPARRRKLFVLLLLLPIGGARELGASDCPLPGGGAISGRVTAAASDAPIVGGELVLERIVDGFLQTIATTTTGPTGHYQFAAIAAGDYFVRTQATDLLVDEVWPGVACDQACDPQEAGSTVPVAPNSSVEAIDFTLVAGGRIEGVVLLADGTTPVPGALVEGYALGLVGTFGLPPVVAGADGAWFFEGLETRNYKVRAYAPGLVAEVFPDAPCPMNCDVLPIGSPIAVTAGATTSGIDVALAAGGSVSGTVTDLSLAPLAGVNVSLRESPGFRTAQALTDANGDWITVEGLPAGTYFARTGSEHQDELWDDLPCEPFCTMTSGTPIVVGAAPVTGIDFALARLGAISGTIVETGSGLPLGNVSVVARGGGPFPGGATTASDGTYRIGGLAPGSYLVAAVDGVHVGEIYDDAGTCYDPFNCLPSSPNTVVDVVGAGETADIDFELDPGGVLSGVVVVAATNAPVNGALVAVARLDGGFETLVNSDTSGGFRISGMPAGVSYRVVAQPSGGAGLLGEVWEEQPCEPGSCVADGGTPVPVTIDSPTCLTFTLDGVTQGFTGIAGQVVAQSGPLAGVQIAIYDASGALEGTVGSDASGAYLTTGALNLAAGTYYAVASGAFGYANELFDDLPCNACDPTTGTPIVVVEDATTSGIDFSLEPLATPPLPLIFLEDCKPGGCIYFRSLFEDSRANRSSILGPSTASLPEFALPSDLWGDLVACVQRSFRPFAVEVTDVDPGAVAHLEHVVAGFPQNIGQDSGTLGVSPFSCGFIPNSISFTFAGVLGTVPSQEVLDELCWTVVHEVAHQHGLDHHFYVPDAMTYMPGCGPKLLPARDVPCGEFSQEPCLCGGSSENSYARIRTVYGASDLVFGDGFEIVEPGQNCAWSAEVPPPVPFGPLAPLAPITAPEAPGAIRCGALEPSNPGFRPQPKSPD